MAGKKGGKWYTNGLETIKIFPGDVIPEGYWHGVHYKHDAWNKGKTAQTDERVKANGQATRETRLQNGSYIAWNEGLTKETDSRIKCLSGEENPMYGKHPEAWNKGKTKENDPSMKKASENHKGCTPWNKDQKIGSFWTEESAAKSYETRAKNGTLGKNADTIPELETYKKLLESFSEEDIVKQYFDKDRYPFKCDFYIKSIDKFIEVHGNWTHGDMPFDPENPECQLKLAQWQEKAKDSDYYRCAIYTWTDLDVRKLETAKKNNLNYEVIYYKY